MIIYNRRGCFDSKNVVFVYVDGDSVVFELVDNSEKKYKYKTNAEANDVYFQIIRAMVDEDDCYRMPFASYNIDMEATEWYVRSLRISEVFPSLVDSKLVNSLCEQGYYFMRDLYRISTEERFEKIVPSKSDRYNICSRVHELGLKMAWEDVTEDLGEDNEK